MITYVGVCYCFLHHVICSYSNMSLYLCRDEDDAPSTSILTDSVAAAPPAAASPPATRSCRAASPPATRSRRLCLLLPHAPAGLRLLLKHAPAGLRLLLPCTPAAAPALLPHAGLHQEQLEAKEEPLSLMRGNGRTSVLRMRSLISSPSAHRGPMEFSLMSHKITAPWNCSSCSLARRPLMFCVTTPIRTDSASNFRGN